MVARTVTNVACNVADQGHGCPSRQFRVAELDR